MNADGSTETGSLIDDIVREGATARPAAALEAEVDACTAELDAQCDEAGRRLVVRNGYHRKRSVTTAAGPVEVKAPRESPAHRRGHRRAQAVLLEDPAAVVPQVTEGLRVLPLLYPHGLSSGDMPALEQFPGSWAAVAGHRDEADQAAAGPDHAAFQDRDLSQSDYVYVWADGCTPRSAWARPRS